LPLRTNVSNHARSSRLTRRAAAGFHMLSDDSLSHRICKAISETGH
jgi:hypothetical protein